MELDSAKLFSLADRIKTPLALAGAVVVALYLIFRQVLNLQVFSNVGSQPTFLIIQSVIDKVFWLAVLATTLGILSYLAVALRGSKLKASDETDDVKLSIRKKHRAAGKSEPD
jgi:uncharacterized membrane protein YjgN (DUF898 family)